MAYAAVTSLKYTIESLDLESDFPSNIREMIKSAHQKLDYLSYCVLQGLNYKLKKSFDRSRINDLDAEIRDAVWKLEDVLESYQLSQGIADEKEVEQEIDSFFKTENAVQLEYHIALNMPLLEDIIGDKTAAVSPVRNSSTTVGLSDISQQITTQLLSGKSHTKVVSLWGMAGIGKTHLARLIYHDPSIAQHFNSRVWVSVGQKNEDSTKILVDILTQIQCKLPGVVFTEKTSESLVYLLQKILSGGRHLIVLDDVWSIYVLFECLKALPHDESESRFLLTTRQESVTDKHWWGSSNKVHHMPFLSNEESWSLFWQNVFVDESNFPSQLEKAGRKIAEHCEGLPLLILAVADILRELEKTKEYWKKVAEKKTTTFTEAYEKIYEVLLLSYDYLPHYIRPCFLYMGVFPQSREIPFSKLINLWTVENFLEPRGEFTVETLPVEYIKILVSNSLAIVCKRSFERVRRVKSCKLHSVYWYLCVKEGRKSKLFHALNKLTDAISIKRPRRLSVQINALFGLKEVYDSMVAATSTTRSLLFTGEDHQYPVRICFNIMLLMKVLDCLAIRFYKFPEEVLNLLKLRYLALTHNGEFPSSISRLHQLEWLILSRHHSIKLMQRDSTSCLPEEIWDLQELKYLRIVGSNLPDPSEGRMLWKLLTLYVNADSCREDVLRSIPNLKKLGIKIELEPDVCGENLRFLEHIEVLKKLESLKCVVVNPFKLVVAPPADHLSNLPGSLKRLSLDGFGYSWKHMTAIGSLRSLQVLKLRCSAFQGSEWKTKGGQFESLEFLLLEDIDLVHWINQKCFPYLHHLIVRHCYKLKKIPVSIGGIETLETMEVDDCSPSVVASAHQIKEKTKSPNLEVVINSSWNI